MGVNNRKRVSPEYRSQLEKLTRQIHAVSIQRDIAFEFILRQVEDAWGSLDVAIESGWYVDSEVLLNELKDWKDHRYRNRPNGWMP